VLFRVATVDTLKKVVAIKDDNGYGKENIRLFWKDKTEIPHKKERELMYYNRLREHGLTMKGQSLRMERMKKPNAKPTTFVPLYCCKDVSIKKMLGKLWPSWCPKTLKNYSFEEEEDSSTLSEF